jgi:nucleoid DNA-binding protein
MNKHELSKIVAAKTGLSRTDASVVIDVIINRLKRGLCEEGRVELRGLGSFEVRQRAPRKGRIISTGETVSIPARKTVVFTPGKVLKELVNQK